MKTVRFVAFFLMASSLSDRAAEAQETTTSTLTAEERLLLLEDKIYALEEQLRQHEEMPISRGINVEVGGYVDFGFFIPQGDGSGFVQDFGNEAFPEYAGQY